MTHFDDVVFVCLNHLNLDFFFLFFFYCVPNPCSSEAVCVASFRPKLKFLFCSALMNRVI